MYINFYNKRTQINMMEEFTKFQYANKIRQAYLYHQRDGCTRGELSQL